MAKRHNNKSKLPLKDEGALATAEPEEQIQTDTALAVVEARQRPINLDDGLSLLPVEQMKPLLKEYDARRAEFRKWLLSHLQEGVHYGYPPGCKPMRNDKGEVIVKDKNKNWSVLPPEQWQSKPTLYKAGALLLVDLLKFKARFSADKAAWEQFGSQAGMIVMKCEVLNPATNEVLGEGRGVFRHGENPRMNENATIKMAEKRALVDALINTVAVCGDLFTQDIGDPAEPSPQPQADPFAPNAPTRSERQQPARAFAHDDLRPLFDQYTKMAVAFWNEVPKAEISRRFKAYVQSIAGKDVETCADWTQELFDAVKARLDSNQDPRALDEQGT